MRKSTRWLVVGAVALGGIILLWLGISGWRAILAAGQEGWKMRGTLAYTVGGVLAGGGMLLWCLFAGIPWARSRDGSRSPWA
jgi:hypothetical protein